MRIVRGIIACCVLVTTEVLAGQPTLTARQLAQDPQIYTVALSPKATRFVAWINRGSTESLIVRSLGSTEKPRVLLTSDEEHMSINWLKWASDDRLIVSVTYPGIRETHLLAVPVNGDASVELISPKVFSSTYSIGWTSNYIVDWMPDDGRHILVQLSGASFGNSPDVYEIDLVSGAHKIVHPSVMFVEDWVTDRSHRVRVAVREKGDDTQIQVSDVNGESWRTAWTFKEHHGDGIIPLGFAADPNLLYVSAMDDGRRAIFEVNLLDPALTLKRVSKRDTRHVDGFLEVDPRSGRAVGVNNYMTRMANFWDPDYLGLAKSVDMGLPDRHNQLKQVSDDGQRYLVTSEAGGQPSQFFVGNRKTGELAFLGDSRPDLPPESLMPSTELTLRARNGFDLPATLTKPRGNAKQPWPVVILPTGPAHVRNAFNPMSQLLANKGIAVLELGMRDYVKADPKASKLDYKRWFKDGYEDIDDAARWLVDQGIADTKRICLEGEWHEVHGMYLAAAQSPNQYRCIAAWNGASDLVEWGIANAKLPGSDSYVDDFLGRIRWEDELKDLSPLRHAKTIKANAFVAVEDWLNTGATRQSTEMELALRSAGVDVEAVSVKYDKALKPKAYSLERHTKRLQLLSDYLVKQLKP